MSLESYILRIQKEQGLSCADRAVLGGLSLLEKMYLQGVLRRRKKERAQMVKAGIPVISAGNLTAGGTGKTPCIMKLARFLLSKGRHPAVLTRGYKGELEHHGGIVSDQQKILISQVKAGDEPYMMAAALPGVPVIVGKDRIVSAAAAKALGADVLLLDDGFQYWRLFRDLDIVLIDSTNPFGGGHVLPRGLLREPMDALERAGLFLLTKSGQVTADKREEIIQTLSRYAPHIPVIETDHVPSSLVSLEEWPGRAGSKMPDGKVMLLCGIGNPLSFELTAAEAGLSVTSCMAFPDHHQYSENDLSEASRRAEQEGASALVITEKDAVKIKANLDREGKGILPLYVLGITMKCSPEGEALLWQKVEEIL